MFPVRMLQLKLKFANQLAINILVYEAAKFKNSNR